MRIFVSYSSRNRPQVKALVQDLENTGHDVWYDQEAAGGHEWWADILENIRACELFIFALTPESLDSEACRWEYRYAHALHKRILPVRLNKEVNPASLTIELQKINFVDYFSGAEQEYRQLVRAITSLRPPVPMPEPMPDEPPVPISPLGELREKIAARSIGVETQTYLVFELKQHVEKAATRAEALALLQRLQSHPDMRVGVANEIKTIITPYIPRKLPETPPTSARIWPTRRMMAGGLVGLVAIGVVVALVILLSGGDEGDREKQTDAGDQTEAALDLTDTPTQTPSPTKQISSTNTTTATQRPSETSTPTSRATSTNTATNTYTPTLTPSATNTPSQTATITPTPTATLPSGFEKVTSNAQWKEMGGPIERDFDGVMMVLVPVGCFDMGSTLEQRHYAAEISGVSLDSTEDETPVTKICFDRPFWIDKYEVTNIQFALLGGSAQSLSEWTSALQPRENITWVESHRYCEQRGGRLPTESEWEYVSRGPDELIFPWGNQFSDDNVVYGSNSNGKTAEVGSRVGGVSWVGANDLSGNVWEWVSSTYLPYDSDIDREEFDDSLNRVIRGGSINNGDLDLRSAVRGTMRPTFRYSWIGFRCVRDYNGELGWPNQ